MSAGTHYAAKRREWRSGFCGISLPVESHRRCSGHSGKSPCACICHRENRTPNGETMTTEVAAPEPEATVVITEPGLYDGMPNEVYHGQHDWLSVSGAKKLLPPSCPAKFKAQLGVEQHKRQFDLGKVAHARILGEGDEYVVVQKVCKDKTKANAEDYVTKSAQQHRDEIRAEGKVPILAHELEVVEAMAESLAQHPIAPHLFAAGKAEQSVFWIDQETGVQCRARFDWLPDVVDGKRLIVPDVKTAVSAEPGEFSRAAARYHYVMQDDWYSTAVRALGLDRDPAFLFVVIEKEPPYLVTVGQFGEDDKALGRALNDRARRIYAECVATDTWPGYHPGIADLALPGYHTFTYEEFLNNDQH